MDGAIFKQIKHEIPSFLLAITRSISILSRAIDARAQQIETTFKSLLGQRWKIKKPKQELEYKKREKRLKDKMNSDWDRRATASKASAI